MKLFLAIFAVLSALVCSQAAVKSLGERIECFRDVQTRIYESRIKELVEDLRDQLKNGIPEKNIPAMDPFVMDNWNLKIDEPFAKLDWNMNGKIDGLMGWDLNEIKFSIAGFKFSYGIHAPEIAGKGTYKIDGSLADVLPIFGSGEFDVLAQNLRIFGDGKIGSRGSGEDQHLFLEKFSIGISLEKFTFAVDGLMDDDQLSLLLSQMISESLPDLIENFQSQINAVVSAKVTAAADSMLQNMTIADLLAMLKPKPPKPTELSLYTIHCGDY